MDAHMNIRATACLVFEFPKLLTQATVFACVSADDSVSVVWLETLSNISDSIRSVGVGQRGCDNQGQTGRSGRWECVCVWWGGGHWLQPWSGWLFRSDKSVSQVNILANMLHLLFVNWKQKQVCMQLRCMFIFLSFFHFVSPQTKVKKSLKSTHTIFEHFFIFLHHIQPHNPHNAVHNFEVQEKF